MPVFSFIKIVNNNDASDFLLDVTQMKNVRLRVSSLRNQCWRHYELGSGKYRPVYRYFWLDHSFYRVEKAELPDLAAARVHKESLQLSLVSERENKLIAKKAT